MAAPSSVIELNVGGALFTTTRSTLTSDKSRMLARMFREATDSARDSQDRVFIDRDGTHFSNILQWLRNGPAFALPKRLSQDQLRDLQLECDFYQLNGLQELITAAINEEARSRIKSHSGVEYTSVGFFQNNKSGVPEVYLRDVNALGAEGWQVHSVVGDGRQHFLMSRAIRETADSSSLNMVCEDAI